jgi:hypothetical protein
VISSAFSWYNTTTSPWSTKALWYSGLLFAMASITAAGVHSAGLHRLGVHPSWQTKLRETLGTPVRNNPTEWRPRALQPLMWQTPNFLLKLSIVCFIVGLVILIWDTARLDGVRWGNNDAKVNFEFDRGIGIIVLMQIDCYPVHRCDLHLFIVVCSIRSWPVL